MTQKTPYIIIILIFMSLLAVEKNHAKKIAVLNDYYKAPAVLMDDKQIYVTDRSLIKISIYERKNFKKIAEFGKRGEAPGEFIGINKVFLLDDYICVSSFPKLCYFSKSGKFKKEIKGPPNAGSFIPAGKNFIGISYPSSDTYDKECPMQFSLFDAGLKKIKDIYLTKIHKAGWPGETKANILWIRACVKAVPYNDKVFIGIGNKDIFFAVFDAKGNMLYMINKASKERKVTENEKNKRISEIKEEWGKQRWNEYKLMYNMVFPDYYPAFSNFFVDNDKIYVFLYPGEKSTEVLILDMKGELLRQANLPLVNQDIIYWGRFAIKDGKFYYVDENIDKETWELHELNIDGGS